MNKNLKELRALAKAFADSGHTGTAETLRKIACNLGSDLAEAYGEGFRDAEFDANIAEGMRE
ncbi:hypothetical protein [Tomitella gaofuii]|uniref:hypothetical protein n=1 Tax=Tomitella gaofuii TaxID=2760083 RepID=UPI0015F9A84B|nr:hypothetical protein [Tomitella gaofuii]